ncbi:hypothetical protein ACHQM5_007589 [Ranunculus cassubicifolius]
MSSQIGSICHGKWILEFFAAYAIRLEALLSYFIYADTVSIHSSTLAGDSSLSFERMTVWTGLHHSPESSYPCRIDMQTFRPGYKLGCHISEVSVGNTMTLHSNTAEKPSTGYSFKSLNA